MRMCTSITSVTASFAQMCAWLILAVSLLGGNVVEAATANAGPDIVVVDSNGNGTEAVALSSAGSSGTTFSWSRYGVVLSTLANPTLTLAQGQHPLLLTVDGTATDTVLVTVADIGAATRSSWNYPPPYGIVAHPDFLVEARRAGTNDAFESIFVHQMQVCKDKSGWNGSASVVGWTYEMTGTALFDAPGPMEIRVTKTSGSITNAVLRPLSRNLTPSVNGNQISFVIGGPTKLVLEINGERYRNLNILANPVDTAVPAPGTPGVKWYGAGVHNILGTTGTGRLELLAGETLYLAPGAVVKGAVRAQNAAGVTVRGRGILSVKDFADDSYHWGIEAWRCANFRLEGILLTGAPDNSTVLSDCTGMQISNFKVVDGRHWDDGIHINAGKNITIDDCFIRTADDSVVFYGGNWVNYGYTSGKWTGVNQDVDNVQVTNCVLWSDVAHPMLVGTHGMYSTGGSVLQNITFRNIDVLEHRATTYQGGVYQGVMSLTANDGNIVRDILFEDVRVERMTQGQLFHAQTNINTDYSKGPGERIDRIVFRRVSWLGTSAQEALSDFKTESALYPIDGITFDSCMRNGTWITNATTGNLRIGTNVTNVTYLPTTQAPGITVQPAATVTVLAGQRATLRVSAAGGTPLSYQWYAGNPGDVSSPVSGATAAVFTTPTLSSSSVYWVKVSNSLGSVNSTSSQVVVVATPATTYAVIYSGNGSTGGAVPTDGNTYLAGATVTVLGNTGGLVKSGSTFAGWNTAANGSGSSYAGGWSFTMGSSPVTLYAMWTVLPTYTISYDANTATSGAAPASQTKTQGLALTLATNSGNLTKTGYTFAGWNTAANGSGTNYTVGASYTADAAVTLYATWTPLPTYTVTGVVTVGGSGQAGVSVTDGTRTVLTDGTGAYTLVGVPAGTYTLTPSLTGYAFTPAAVSITVSGTTTVAQVFSGTPTSGSLGTVRVAGSNSGGGCGAGLGALLLCGLCLGITCLRRRL